MHPAEAVIWGSGDRLGRIPADLWGGYDALRISGTIHDMIVLSAKACAVFPDKTGVLIKVGRHREGETIRGHHALRGKPMEDAMQDLDRLGDPKLVVHYERTEPESPDVDRIVNEMAPRRGDY
jgi:hypothetical protein